MHKIHAPVLIQTELTFTFGVIVSKTITETAKGESTTYDVDLFGHECSVDFAECEQKYKEQQRPSENEARWCADEPCGCGMVVTSQNPGPTNGFWGAADWLLCRDGKWRATQSIAIEMADGLADRLGYSRFSDRWSLNPLIQKAENRVGRLKGYGNAINAEQAKAFIAAFMEVNR